MSFQTVMLCVSIISDQTAVHLHDKNTYGVSHVYTCINKRYSNTILLYFQHYCRSLGAHLARVESVQEKNVMAEELKHFSGTSNVLLFIKTKKT